MSIPILSKPPGKTSSPYIIPYMEGECIYFPAGHKVDRLTVTGVETGGDYAIVQAGAACRSEIVLARLISNMIDRQRPYQCPLP